MDRNLRWGILSTARIGVRYIQALREARNGELAAVASRDPAKAEAFAREHGIPKSYGSYEALLADPTIDVIYNPLPNSLHAPLSKQALAAGKHVVCEKPLTVTLAEAEDLVAYAKHSGKILAEGLMYRRHPMTQKAYQIVHSGEIGEPGVIRSTFCAAITNPADIRFDPALGGGALFDLGIYCIDVIRFLAAEEPTEVKAVAIPHPEHPSLDLQMCGVLRFPSQRLGHFECGFALRGSCSYEVTGSEGRLLIDEGGMVTGPGRTGKIRLWIKETYEEIDFAPEDFYRLTIEEFGDAVLFNRPLSYGLDESFKNMELIHRLRTSAGLI